MQSPRVGIDIERDGAVRPRHARYFLRPDERCLARRLGLTAVWSLKEAVWKALRLDGTVPFRSLALHADHGGRLEAVSLGGRPMPASALVTRPRPGFILAVVLVDVA